MGKHRQVPSDSQPTPGRSPSGTGADPRALAMGPRGGGPGRPAFDGREARWYGGRAYAARAPVIVAFPTEADRAGSFASSGLVSFAAASFIQQGAIVGAVLGLAGGLARRPVRGGLAGAAAGLMLGAAVATGAAYGLLPVYYRNVDLEGRDLTYPLLTHGGSGRQSGPPPGWHLGLGLGARGRRAGSALGGLLGGIAATMVYEPIGALGVPARQDEPAGLRDRPTLASSPISRWGCSSPPVPLCGGRGDIPPSGRPPPDPGPGRDRLLAPKERPRPGLPAGGREAGPRFTGRRQ